MNKEYREPTNYDDIFNLIDKDEWLESAMKELNNFKNLGVFEPVDNIPYGTKLIIPLWIFKYKRNCKGEITDRKSRIVANGSIQEYGVNHQETFSPTPKLDSIRLFIAVAIQNNFIIQQIDINAAYLNAKLKETIYMKPPKGHPDFGIRYWKLKKAIYGLKQSGREWNEELNNFLLKIKFKRLISEPCLYIMEIKKKIICILSVYVDDILIAGNKEYVEKIKNLIKKKFKIKDIGYINFMIGIKFIRYKNGYIMNQTRYINELVTKFNINNQKPERNLIPIEDKELRKIKIDSTKYKSVIGNLLYISICTRPDIMFAVSKAARKAKEPTMEDFENAMKILRYLNHTKNYGIKFSNKQCIKAYTDADYGGDLETRKSTTGFVIKIGDSPISWCSKLQRCISTSTAEAEYYSLSECCKQCIWYLNILNELKINTKNIIINIDNKAAIYNAKNQSINPKTKHMDIRVHFVRELIKENKIKLEYIKSHENLADGFTKYLNSTAMDDFRNSLLIELKDSDI